MDILVLCYKKETNKNNVAVFNYRFCNLDFRIFFNQNQIYIVLPSYNLLRY